MQISGQSSLGVDDHCLVHHFIRANGRRPSADELLTLSKQLLVSAGPDHRRGQSSGSLPQALRREVARLIHRL
jgi:hypothetical protein